MKILTHPTRLIAPLLLACAVTFSTSSNATIITHGDLSYDTTTQIISGNGKDYLGFGVGASWNYATTVANTSSGGAYSDFAIANNTDADTFISSLFGSLPDSCSNPILYSNHAVTCGTLSSLWSDGDFGPNLDESYDSVWFIADRSTSQVGYLSIDGQGSVAQNEAFSTIAFSDSYSNNSGLDISWLLVRDTAAVPEPSIIALMGLGLFGLGLSRRKLTK